MTGSKLTYKDIEKAVYEQNLGRPAWLLEIGILYFCNQLRDQPNPQKMFRLRFSNLIRGGWCDIVLDTKKIGGTQDESEPVDP